MTVPHIAAHALLMAASSLLAVDGFALIITLICNVIFMALCVWLWQKPSGPNAWKLYKFSNYYLIVVFFSLALGGTLGL